MCRCWDGPAEVFAKNLPGCVLVGRRAEAALSMGRTGTRWMVFLIGRAQHVSRDSCLVSDAFWKFPSLVC